MRINVYAEEMTDRVELIIKEIDGKKFTAIRFYLQLPASFIQEGLNDARPATSQDTKQARHYSAPFIHHPGDDDSAAVTFWGKKDLRPILLKALDLLDKHYGEKFYD